MIIYMYVLVYVCIYTICHERSVIPMTDKVLKSRRYFLGLDYYL